MGSYILWTLLYLEILIYGDVIGFSETHTCNRKCKFNFFWDS